MARWPIWQSSGGRFALEDDGETPNTQVTLIDHSGKRVRIETSRGTLSAGKAIVTVPTNLIADQSIRFHPALPEKLDSILTKLELPPTPDGHRRVLAVLAWLST